MLPTISNEQQEVVDALQSGHNVIVNSVAGSGKTTCNLHIAHHFKDKRILLLTYNAKLKIETREKIERLQLTNIETHSYHSFCVRYYNNTCYTDSEIIALLKTQPPPIKRFSYDMIILDEAQDISPLYFNLICKVFRDNRVRHDTKPQIVILGDEKQSIFDFNKADQRFITMADKVFLFNDYPWKNCHLSRSFRITHEMSEFINYAMLPSPRIFSQKVSGIKPRYIICNGFGHNSGYNKMFSEFEYYLDLGYLPSEIFILAPSIKNPDSPIRKLENKIKQHYPDIPIFVPNGDDAKLDKDILENKMVFSTFHQSKGLERKVVLVSGFDDSYFKFFKKKAIADSCPNELYVATTRALECMTLFHDYQNDYLPFLNKPKIHQTCEFIKHQELCRERPKKKEIKIGVCDLIKHLSQDVLDDCYNQLEIEMIREPSTMIDIDVKTIQLKLDDGNHLKEEVSEITGIAMQFYVEYLIHVDIQTYHELIGNHDYEDAITFYDMHNSDKVQDFDFETMTPQTLLKIANCWNSCKTGFLFKLQQIVQYDWVSEKHLSQCYNRLEQFGFDPTTQFEVHCKHKQESARHNIDIHGFIDFTHNDNIYELKCVHQLKKEHYLQLALYKYLYEKSTKNYECNYYLYNLLTDELVAIKNDHASICKMVEFLIEKKYADAHYVSNEVFLFERDNSRKLYYEQPAVDDK
jgi:hypothetical protein